MITVAVLKPIPKHGIDEVEFEFDLEDDIVAMIDRLVGTGFGIDRGEVIKNVIEHSLRRNEMIGRCDLCGLIDHHLFEGACGNCRTKFNLPGPAAEGYSVGEIHPASINEASG